MKTLPIQVSFGEFVVVGTQLPKVMLAGATVTEGGRLALREVSNVIEIFTVPVEMGEFMETVLLDRDWPMGDAGKNTVSD